MMHRFQPTRASPPIKSSVLSASTRTDHSVAVAPELQQLSPEDIDILDAVINRAGPSATTFFKIFKAYSDVLKERGLDPQEVVYYGKLLKLGTLKGKDWGEKWEMVKAQDEYTPATPTLDAFQSESEFHHPLSQTEFSEASSGPPPQRTAPQRMQPTSWDPPKPATIVPLRRRPTVQRETTRILQPRFKHDTREMSSISTAFLASKAIVLDLESTVASDDVGQFSSPVPPSYKSTAIARPLARAAPKRPETVPFPTAPKIPLIPKERKKVIDPDDAWKNIRMEQDEKYADKFREETLVRHCWRVWTQGLAWIKTTHQQIDEARDRHLLGLFLQRWQNHIISRNAIADERINGFQRRNLKPFFKIWQTRLKQRRQTAWRNDMRQKMKAIKNKQDAKIKMDAWATWRQLHLLRRADNHCQTSLLARYHARWKGKLVQLDNLDAIADNFSEHIYLKSLDHAWNLWKQATSLRRDENIISQRVDCRIMANAFDMWRKRTAQNTVGERFRERMILQRVTAKWRQSLTTLRTLDRRADKHIARQDDLLRRAVLRIWRARMRGKKFEDFRSSHILKNAWQCWRTRMTHKNSQMDAALVQFNRTNTRLATSTLSRWHQVLTTHKNAHAYAVTYDKDRLRAKAVVLCRLRLREHLQSAKVARWANRFFATRRAWNIWIAAMEERKRQERLKLWNISKAAQFFNVWHRRTVQEQCLKESEQVVRDRVEKRIIFGTLVHWTNRVIELKSRELDVAHRHDVSLQRAAFKKWKLCRRKHMEELSLLENYLLVRREDILRRAFVRWLTAKRSIEYRRSTHQRKEAHLRQVAITSAWEKWRERFKEERLRPLEYTVIIDNQKNVMSKAFRIWLSKTDSLPAVRFHSRHLKEKFLKRWKIAMPNALRAKKARETDRFNTLVKFFEQWGQAYKTKTTLKAVARAKYLRLPAVTSRQTITRSRPVYSGPRDIFPRRTVRDTEDTESQASDTKVEPLREAFVPRAMTTATSRIGKSPKAKSERSVVRSEYGLSVGRQASPVRSIASMPDRRSRSPSFANVYVSPAQREGGGRLWAALKDIGPTRRPRNLLS